MSLHEVNLSGRSHTTKLQLGQIWSLSIALLCELTYRIQLKAITSGQLASIMA